MRAFVGPGEHERGRKNTNSRRRRSITPNLKKKDVEEQNLGW